MPRLKPHHKKIVAASVALLLLLLLLMGPIPRFVGRMLQSSVEPKPGADALVVLIGDPMYRPAKGAALFKAGVAPKVIVVASGDSCLVKQGLELRPVDVMKGRLVREGVPASKIEIVNAAATSTFEEAYALKDYLLAQKPMARRVVVVTTWSHTGRAAYVYRRIFKGTGITIEFAASASWASGPDRWWRSEEGLLEVFIEYGKWVYYLFKYSFRDFPLPGVISAPTETNPSCVF